MQNLLSIFIKNKYTVLPVFLLPLLLSAIRIIMNNIWSLGIWAMGLGGGAKIEYGFSPFAVLGHFGLDWIVGSMIVALLLLVSLLMFFWKIFPDKTSASWKQWFAFVALYLLYLLLIYEIPSKVMCDSRGDLCILLYIRYLIFACLVLLATFIEMLLIKKVKHGL